LTDQLPPPGWHPDPHDPSRWRWWDGQAWTDQVSAGQASQSDGTLWRAATLWVDSRARVGSWEADVRDESGRPAGSVRGGLEMVLADAARAPQLRLRAERDRSEELAVLSPEAKNDKEFSIADPAGAAVGRVVATESKSSLLSQDRTWWVSLARPLAQPLDSLALGAATTLSNIQMMVVNWHDTRFDD
jgi:Protein of unknown function (DUF2510)